MMFCTDLLGLSKIGKGIKTRSISPENPTGEPGKGGMAMIPENEMETHPARELGQGWKIRPSIPINKGTTTVIADINTSGVIRHIWMVNSHIISRDLILRFYWDDAENPAIECPVGDFFFNAWNAYNRINCATVAVNPAKGFNCFWAMPFKKRCKITIENRSHLDMVLYYQIDYEEREVPHDTAYLHARFARSNPLPYKEDHQLLDIKGNGHYVGTFVAYGAHNNNWWGEGEMKFFIDDDEKFPTICGTGTEDYFLGAYNFENWATHSYDDYTSIYSGFYKIKTDSMYNCQTRFGMYRLHIQDPIYFTKGLRVTLQSIGWKTGFRAFHVQQDDIASVSIYYLDNPDGGESVLPSVEVCEVI